MMEYLGGEIERKFPEGCVILPPASSLNSLNLKIDEIFLYLNVMIGYYE